MKKLYITAALCLALTSASAAFAATPNFYAAIGGGVEINNDTTVTEAGRADAELSYDAGWDVYGAFGMHVPGAEAVRVESELSYLASDYDSVSYLGQDHDFDGSQSHVVALGNVYFDFVNGSVFTPYVTGGIGGAWVDITDAHGVDDYDDFVFAWQVGTGVAVDLSQTVALDLRYRYLATSDADIDGTDVSFDTNLVTLGLRLAF